MSRYTLHCFAQSGNAAKAALMLSICEADWTPRFVDFFNGETRTPEYLAINEMGEVPVLEGDGLRLTQTGVILDYLAGKSGRLGHESEEERREILRWILFDNHKLTSYLATLRFMTRFMKVGETSVTAFLRERAERALAVLDSHLEGRDFAIGARPTIADISMCGYLFWPDEYDLDWDTWPRVQAWLDRIRALPGWVHPYELMPGHPLPDRG